MGWCAKDRMEIKFKKDVNMSGWDGEYSFNKGDILVGTADGFCGSENSKNGYINIRLNYDKCIHVYYRDMEYVKNNTRDEYIYFNKDGSVKETNEKLEPDYLNFGIYCGEDDEYPL